MLKGFAECSVQKRGTTSFTLNRPSALKFVSVFHALSDYDKFNLMLQFKKNKRQNSTLNKLNKLQYSKHRNVILKVVRL